MALRVQVFGDLFRMVKRSGRWWLVPLLLVLTLLGLALMGLQAIEYISPFIYAVL